tara:strand:- start:457 stop:627 length:171 start_codon:yes stop_codon:yes gene_type:complete
MKNKPFYFWWKSHILRYSQHRLQPPLFPPKRKRLLTQNVLELGDLEGAGAGKIDTF